MSILISGFSFIFGACVGSFINVLVGRFEDEDRFWYQGRSVCDHCNRKLKWWENIPLVSYFFLGGKCRSCRSPIPYQYSLVEFLTGISYALIIWNFHSDLLLAISYLLLTTILIVTFLFDLKYLIIPDWTVGGLIILALVEKLFRHPELVSGSLSLRFRNEFGMTILVGLLSSLFLLILHLITKGKGMGLGDVKFAFFMGLFLGWPRIIVGFYLAFLTGAIIGVILILMGRKKFGQVVPFGPFLVLGTFISWIWGFQLIDLFFQWTKIITLSL